MIHHLSISAGNPLQVAQVLAEILQGQVAPFPPHPGSYLVAACDEYGTMIEIYPMGTEMKPGQVEDEQATFTQNLLPSSFTATHVALSVPASREQIEQIAEREGWRALYCSREGFFEVVELWIENRLLIELLPPSIAPLYLSFMQPQNLQKFFAADSPWQSNLPSNSYTANSCLVNF
ncbi:hypothetical protein [Leptolyngbya sp. FACHB-261]|uniref:hypothetical protein n=1 Tax=Leptolyngbya sp. FACHB-261 TaxID=2692806 RepID=UPI0016861A95|nr:hypothetical protein [Leptolyngbya sp. FACHB-261]MBD2102257.1 hypothetical protein [Leptolyngbya sp. FACHB-261]